MKKRLLLLPVTWGVFGLGIIEGLTLIFGPILNDLPYAPNDKPIGGSYLPATFFVVASLIAMIALSLYSLGVWEVDLSSRKTRVDIAALSVMIVSGLLIFTSALFLVPLVVTLVYFMATNIE
jgi:hypothetical protein